MNKKIKIVTIGGGTGSFMILSGLKKFDVDLTAIVSMADDGGSTGILRDDLGVLPPGDIRQCLVALSKSSEMLRELFNYRYSQGGFSGHNFGNLFLSTLEKVTGSFEKAVKEAGTILRIKGKVVPVTLKNTKLIVEMKSGKKIIGEHIINESDLTNFKKIYLKPKATANQEAIKAIREADKIIVNPGNLYGSLLPNFLVVGIGKAIAQSKAKKIMIANLMTKQGHTDNFTVADYIKIIEKYCGKNIIDYVIYNTEKPDEKLLKYYNHEGEFLVEPGELSAYPRVNFIGKKLLSKSVIKQNKNDLLKRTLVRHDSAKLAKIIYNI